MVTRLRQSQASVYAQVFGLSVAYVAMITGFAYQIARSAGIA